MMLDPIYPIQIINTATNEYRIKFNQFLVKFKLSVKLLIDYHLWFVLERNYKYWLNKFACIDYEFIN